MQVQWKYLMKTNHCDYIERFLFLCIAELLPNPLFSCDSFGLYINISQEQVAILCVIPLWISMISSIMSCINGLQSLGKQHKGVFCQIHWDSMPSMLHVFLLLLLHAGKTSPHYVKSPKQLLIPSVGVFLIICDKTHILKIPLKKPCKINAWAPLLNSKLSCMQGIVFTLVKGKVQLYEYYRNSDDHICFWTLFCLLVWDVLDLPEFSSSLNHQESQESQIMQPLCSKGKVKVRDCIDSVL